MSRRERRAAAAGATGGSIAGAVLSGMVLPTERATHGPSDLTLMGGAARELDLPRPRLKEQVSTHAGHVVLSAALGAGLGTTDPKAGLVLGRGFDPLAFGLLRPVVGTHAQALG